MPASPSFLAEWLLKQMPANVKPFAVALLLLMTFVLGGCTGDNTTEEQRITIGIAWCADTTSEFYTNIIKAVREAGATPVLMPQVMDYGIPYTGGNVSSECVDINDYLATQYAEMIKQNPLNNSNVESAIGDVDGVIFTGGEDISPTLLAKPQPWHGIENEKDYNPTRDVSDYILMSYCISHDISVMGICRGMQVLGVVSGAEIIQDIPTYFAEKGQTYNHIHRNQAVAGTYRDYSPHAVMVAEGSILYDLSGHASVIENVPSWHHQVLKSVDGTRLSVTGFTPTNGENFIEAIERTDKTLIFGLQFHPEASIVKYNTNTTNASDFMSKDQALAIFKHFVEKVRERKQQGK